MPLYARFNIFDSLEGFQTITFNDQFTVIHVNPEFQLLNPSLADHQENVHLSDYVNTHFYNKISPSLNTLALGGLTNFIYQPDETNLQDFQCLCFALRHADGRILYKLGIRPSDPNRRNETIVPILLHAINSTREGIAITDEADAQKKLIFLNDSLRENAITKNHYQLGAPDTLSSQIAPDCNITEGGRLTLKDPTDSKEQHSYSVTTTTIQDELKTTSHKVKIHHNITKIIALQDLLQSMYQSYQRLFDESPVPMYVTDAAGRFIQVNRNLCQLLKKNSAALLGINHLTFFAPESLPVDALESNETFLKHLQNDENLSLKTLELQIKADNLEKHWIQLNCAEKTDSDIQHKQYLCSWSNMDRTKTAEIQHLLLIEKLQESNFQLQHFAHIASHDLQAPLNKCASYLYLMEDAIDQGKVIQADLLQKAIKACFDMKLMIKHMLRDAKENKDFEDIIDIPLNNCVAIAIENLHSLIARSDAKLDVATLPEVIGNPAQITRVFQNLISNAIKYRSNETPLIRINARKINTLCEVSVTDNGIGIPEKNREHIFKVFEQGDTRNSGQGLGLTICKKLVEELGGTIHIDSEYSKGTRFIFTIPLAQKLLSGQERHVM